MLQWMISWMSTILVTFVKQPDFHLFVSRDISRLTFILHYRTDKIIMNVEYDIDSIDKNDCLLLTFQRTKIFCQFLRKVFTYVGIYSHRNYIMDFSCKCKWEICKNFYIFTIHESFNSQNQFDNSLKLQSICKNCFKNISKKVQETFHYSTFKVNGMLRTRILCETIFIYWLLHKICN